MMKQTSKQILTMLAFVLPFLGMVFAVIPAVKAQTLNDTVVTDPLTGKAIYGWDAVSFFTEPQPLQGRGDFEFVWNNVAWQFANAANRDIFMRNPDIYAPQFGGHCAMGLSRGYISDADPRYFTVFKGRLFFFYSAGNREAFLRSPDNAAIKASMQWPLLMENLAHK
jgi:YHS domain-containing protein